MKTALQLTLRCEKTSQCVSLQTSLPAVFASARFETFALSAMPTDTLTPAAPNRRAGLLAALISYLFWGFMSLYWSLLEKADSWEVIAHRVVWTLVFLGLLLCAQGRLPDIRNTVQLLRRNRTKLAVMLAAALFASLNWWINVIGVVTERVVELGIGTFLTPLISVLLGVLFFSEKLSRAKWTALGLAGTGVAIMILSFGAFPWISLGVSLTWGIYGALKKKLMLDAWISILLEVTLMLPFAMLYLWWLASTGASHFLAGDAVLSAALVGTGIFTGIPLICFTIAAVNLPMNVLGFCQYIAPILTLLLGIFWFREPFGMEELYPLLFIWSGIALFCVTEWRESRWKAA